VYRWTEQGVQVDKAGCTGGQSRVYKWTEHGVQVDRTGYTGGLTWCTNGQYRVQVERAG
jgi:hypothetical protein